MAEQTDRPNHHAFGTFGTSAAEQPWVPKASGGRSSGTFGEDMRPLILNQQLTSQLKPSITWLTGFLPVLFCFLPFTLLFPFAGWLAGLLDIPDNAPVRDQPNGIMWIVIFLSVMAFSMIVGSIIGFLLNLVIAHFHAGWSWSKAIDVFLHSEIPTHWLKPEFQNKSEQASPANRRPSGTSGLAPANSASRAGAKPEASGDS